MTDYNYLIYIYKYLPGKIYSKDSLKFSVFDDPLLNAVVEFSKTISLNVDRATSMKRYLPFILKRKA